MLSLCLRKSSFIYWKENSPSPTSKPNGLAASSKQSNLESIPPHLLYQVQQMASYFELYIMQFIKIIIYHVFRG